MTLYSAPLVAVFFTVSVLGFHEKTHAEVTTWQTSSGTGQWEANSQWDRGVPTGTGTAVLAGGGTATITTPVQAGRLDIVHAETQGNLQVLGGSLSTGSAFVGVRPAANTVIEKGLWTNSGALNIGVATVGSLSVTGGELRTGRINLGRDGEGHMLVTGGKVKVDSLLSVGGAAIPTGAIPGVGSLLVDGGSIDTDSMSVALYGSGTVVLNSGTVAVTNSLNLGSVGYPSDTASFTMRGGFMNVGDVQYGGNLNTEAVLILEGGVLSTHFIDSIGHGIVAKLMFNGGTLQAKSEQIDFIRNFDSGAVRLGSTTSTIDTNGFQIQIPVELSGPGGLHILGTGTLILTGKNIYTGNTTIAPDATLQLGAGDTTGSIESAVENNGCLVLDSSGILTIPGVISGSGCVSQRGQGLSIFLAPHTYSGTTFVQTGTLAQGRPNAFSPHSDVSVDSTGIVDLAGFSGAIGGLFGADGAIITNSGTAPAILDIGTQDAEGQFAGTIRDGSSPITIHKVGKGNMIFTGSNTYTGGTILSSGVLQLGNGGTSGSIVGDVTNHATLVFNHSDDIHFPGIISGNGALIQAGKGVTTLTGSNTYTGGTVIHSGTLMGTTSSLQGEIFNNSSLVFAQSHTGVFRGTISGPGSVTIENRTGKIDFHTDQSFTGTTVIQEGELSVNARLNSSHVLISPYGILSGNGTLAGHLVNSGVLSPGNNGPGSIALHGDYTQGANGLLILQLGSDYDRVTVEGNAQLDGTLQIDSGFVPDPGLEFTILTAKGGVTGTFSQLQFLDPSLQLEVLYDPYAVRLVVSRRIFSGFTTLQQSVADALNETIAQEAQTSGSNNGTVDGDPATSAATGDSLRQAIWVMRFLPDNELGECLEALVPRMTVNFKDILFNATNTQYGQIAARLAAVRAGVGGITLQGLHQEPMAEQMSKHEAKLAYPNGNMLAYNKAPSHGSIFASASGVFSKICSAADLPRISSTTGYFSAGVDWCIGPDASVGVYAGYQGIRSWYADSSWFRSNGIKFGLYGTVERNGFYVNALVGGGVNFLNLNRPIQIRNYHWTARSYPFNGELDSLFGSGYEFHLGSWRCGINTSIQYTYLGISALNESGAGSLNVKTGRQNPSSLVYTLGGSISYLWEINFPNTRILPTVGLFWQHEFLNYGQRLEGRFANGAGTSFFFYTPTGARNNAFGVAGITAQLGPRFGIYSYYNPQFGGGQIISHGVLVGLNFNF